MTRRDFLGASAAASISAPLAAAARRPNIVIVIGDDMTYTDSGVYGNSEVKTPHIDQLASEGMRFTHCFTGAPMCSPCRQMMYTGIGCVRNGAYPNHAKVRPGIKTVPHYLKALGYRVGLTGKRHYWPPEAFPFENLGEKPLGFSKVPEFLSRNKNQPFCLIVASNEPHRPWDRGDVSQYDPAKLTLPSYFVDTPQTRQSLAAYYAEITFLDSELATTMRLVKDAGAEENTMFMFTSEQGSNFAHCKWTLYDTGIRTELIVRWPGHVKPGSVTGAMADYTDFLPTWIEAAGGKPRGLDGRSLLPVLLGQTKEHRDYTFGVQTTRGIFSGSDCYPIRSARDRNWKYIWNLNYTARFSNTVTETGDGFFKSWRAKAKTDARAAEIVKAYEYRPEFELYDLESDPYELTNVAADSRNRTRMQVMQKRMDAWMRQQGDRGIPTEMEALDHQNPMRAEN